MSTWYPRVLLRHYLERGLSNTAIAARVGLSRRTVYRWLATGPLDRDLDPTTVRYPPRRSKPDPYKPPIEERLHVSRAHGRPAVRRGAGCGLSGKPQGYPVKDVAAAGGWTKGRCSSPTSKPIPRRSARWCCTRRIGW